MSDILRHDYSMLVNSKDDTLEFTHCKVRADAAMFVSLQNRTNVAHVSDDLSPLAVCNCNYLVLDATICHRQLNTRSSLLHSFRAGHEMKGVLEVAIAKSKLRGDFRTWNPARAWVAARQLKAEHNHGRNRQHDAPPAPRLELGHKHGKPASSLARTKIVTRCFFAQRARVGAANTT
ncbi:hypothetical protein M405DRAFT_837991 [Rhizopogon salebrosus TDB-379]|nr:hypothetical protein M405DRAFT_837991 [Rhizopogon salebrosus TDB-379]